MELAPLRHLVRSLVPDSGAPQGESLRNLDAVPGDLDAALTAPVLALGKHDNEADR